MNNAVYAIPGLMPPKAVNWMTALNAPEDGSLLFLAHAGDIQDNVTYSINLRGHRPGTIKDPEYEFAGSWDNTTTQLPEGMFAAEMDVSEWPNFLRTSTTLPEGILIPRKVCCGCPIPINELPHLEDIETVWYWVLELPKRALPVGDTTIEVCINGKVRTYVVHRPHFAIHRKDNRTDEYKFYTETLLAPEDVDLTLKSDKTGSISAILPANPPIKWDDYVFFATIGINNTTFTSMGQLIADSPMKVEFEVPKLNQTGAASVKLTAQRSGNVLELPLISLQATVS